jgi:dTDP-4-dehydrorhamnose reductase
VHVTRIAGYLGHDAMNRLIICGYNGVGGGQMSSYKPVYGRPSEDSTPYVQFDIIDENAVGKVFTNIELDVVIHCTDWLAIDMAEDDNHVMFVRTVNVDGTRNISKEHKDIDHKLVYNCNV